MRPSFLSSAVSSAASSEISGTSEPSDFLAVRGAGACGEVADGERGVAMVIPAASIVFSASAVRPAAWQRSPDGARLAGSVGRRDGGSDDVVALAQVDAAVAGGGAAHGAEVGLVEADGHAIVGGEEDDLIAVGDAGGDELVVLLDVDGDDAARHDVGEVLERGLLDGAVARGEEDVLAFFFEVADGEDGDDLFAGLEVDERGHGLALAGGADVGDFVDLEPVDAAGVGEAEQVGVRGVDDELRDEVLFAGLHAEAAGAAAALLAIDGDGRALEVAGVGDGDGDLLVGDEVFELKLGGLVEDLGAAGIAVLVADLFELLDDDAAELLVARRGWTRTRRCCRGPRQSSLRSSSMESWVRR